MVFGIMHNYVLIQIFLWFLKNKYQSALLFLLEMLKPRHFSINLPLGPWLGDTGSESVFPRIQHRNGLSLADAYELASYWLMTGNSWWLYRMTIWLKHTRTQHTHTTLQIIQIHENLINSNSQAWKTLNRNISWT